jgi:hypothetical protein
MERREHQRRRFWLPVEVEGIDGGFAVSHDASEHGLLLVCSSTLDVGAAVKLKMRLPPGGPVEVPISARVVRVAPNEEDPQGLWPYKMAVQFDEPLAELERYLTELPDAPKA